VQQRTVKEWYTTAEAAQLLGKAEFNVREWCRLKRVRAEKKKCGRGVAGKWREPQVLLAQSQTVQPTFFERRA